jgi:hypothetical protein
MDTPLTQTSALYALRGSRNGRPYIAAAFSDVTSAVNYSRRAKCDLVIEPIIEVEWPLYIVEYLDERGDWKLVFTNREGMLHEIEQTHREEGDHLYMVIYQVPCDWLGHPREPGQNIMDKLRQIQVDNWFLDAYDNAGPEEFDWF